MDAHIASARFCLIGPGRLGTAITSALLHASLRVDAVGVRAARQTQPTAVPPHLPLADAIQSTLRGRRDTGAPADGPLVIWLAVPDDVIHQVARQAAEAVAAAPERPAVLYAVHSCGYRGLDDLEPLRRVGAKPLSLHPLQSFAPGGGHLVLQGVPIAVTARDAATAAFGAALASRLGGRAFDLPEENKLAYHLAAVVASNLFVALESQAAELMGEAAGPGSTSDGLALLGPILQTTLDNLLAHGPGKALTGPVARGDVGTVRAHLTLLDKHQPRFAAAYRALSIQALSLAAPRLDNETVRTLRGMLEGAQGGGR